MKLRIIHEDKYGNLLLTRKFNELIKALRTHQGNHVVVSSKNTPNEAVIKKDFSSTPKGTLILYQNSYAMLTSSESRISQRNHWTRERHQNKDM